MVVLKSSEAQKIRTKSGIQAHLDQFKFLFSVQKGLIQTGAWVIFYDFNCIKPNVLSVVAQQMLTIQSAKAQNAIKMLFQDTTLKLDASCGVFVTINPDYPGNIGV